MSLLYIDMSEEKKFEELHMDSDSDDYDDDRQYENIKQEGESNNGTIQQSMKHFQPTNKMLSKYAEKYLFIFVWKKKTNEFI